MMVEMNPEDDEVLDNNPGNHDGFEPDNEPSLEPCPEPNVEPHIERDSEPGLVPDLQYVPRGAELGEELKRILAMASELESISYSSTPRDDYLRHRRIQLRTELSTELSKLQRYEAYLDKEAARCQRNRDRIRSDSQKLNLSEPREHYFEAERLQQKQYYEAILDRDAVYWAITRVQAALNTRVTGSFPVKDPFPPDVPIYRPSPIAKIHSGGLGNEAEICCH